MITPRWSAPQAFLEDVALDLAVGEPRVSCRTISLRPMMGRSMPEAWNFVLRVMGDLCGPEYCTRPVPVVCDRRGFFCAAESLLELAQEEALDPVALLAHGNEHLPIEVLLDLAEVWARYAEVARDQRRCTLLLAGAVDTPVFRGLEMPVIELTDFGEAEAAASLIMRLGALDFQRLRRTAMLTGGVPALIQALGDGDGVGDGPSWSAPGNTLVRGGATPVAAPVDAASLWRAVGGLADEMRASVAMALTDPTTASRFFSLAESGAQVEDPVLDGPLIIAGLARRTRVHGTPHVELRTPSLMLLAS